MDRLDELTEVSNSLVSTRQIPQSYIDKRMEKNEEEIGTLRKEIGKVSQLVTDMLQQSSNPARPIETGVTPTFKAFVVKTGMTTPAARGGPNGPSGRPK